MQAFKKPEIARRLDEVRAEVGRGDTYRALSLLRAVLRYESMLLSAAELDAARDAERLAHARLGAVPPCRSGPSPRE